MMLASCQDEMSGMPDVSSEDDPMTITCSVNIPEMSQTLTRGYIGENVGANLKLTILEFTAANKDLNASQWWLHNVYHAETTTATNVADGGTVTFKVTLKSSDQPTRLHLMITNDYIKIPEQGSEATLLPSLTVSNDVEAYWGVVQFNDGLTKTTNENGEVKVELLPEVVNGLKNVPVIRNFARIRVTNKAAGFEFLGFGVIHMPTQGSIAPINTDPENPNVPTLISGSSMMSYANITEVYSGFTPTTATFVNTEIDASKWVYSSGQTNITQAAKYIYEHPYESTRRTYLIIYGNYNGTPGYYKIDIGNLNTRNVFEYYNIIRNIDYNVRILSVNAAGSASVEEALSRAPYNNLMAATETSSMLNVSDGDNMLIVNDTNHIIVEDNATIDVLYRYIKGVTGSQTESNGNLPNPIGLVPGPVIQSVGAQQTYTDASGANWVKYTITCNNPSDKVQTQDFTIVDGNGLGRIIHLVLREPWQYAEIASGVNALVKRGTADDYGNSTTSDVISSAAQQPLTVYFNLPDGLPESMFPLVFQLEAKNQGIENNKIGTLVVSSGASLFDSSKIAISYLKTVSYAEYCYNYVTTDTSNDVDVNSPNTHHTVRCRFLTITATTDNDAEIMIHNPYFSPNASVKFTRAAVN